MTACGFITMYKQRSLAQEAEYLRDKTMIVNKFHFSGQFTFSWLNVRLLTKAA